MDSSLAPLSGLNVPQNVEPILPNIQPSGLQLEHLDSPESQLSPCAPGYEWNEETKDCEEKINVRSPKCSYGFKKYSRMDECRRVKYNVGSQQKGTFRKFWDKHIAPKSPTTTRKPPPVTIKTTAYTGDWFGYGYDFGRNDPHW